MKLRFDAGAAAEPELRATESLVAAARANVAALQRQRSQDQNALMLLLGQGLPEKLPEGAPVSQLRYADLPAGLPSEVLLQRPDVRQAEQSLIAANANIGAARAAFFPRISLTGSLGTASTQLSGLFENTAWSFTGQVLQPLFDAGRNQANLEATRAARDIAVAQYEKAIQTAFRDVADALAGRATLGEQLQAQQAQADGRGAPAGADRTAVPRRRRQRAGPAGRRTLGPGRPPGRGAAAAGAGAERGAAVQRAGRRRGRSGGALTTRQGVPR